LNNFTNAKKIFDFYLEKCAEDTMNQGAQFAQQYAHLKLFRYRIESTLNALESYKIETE
jgi:hypothetical protein